jgi:hypothetical protein
VIIFAVMSWNYAQWSLEDNGSHFIEDEDDCNVSVVGFRKTLEGARSLARKYVEEQEVSEDDGDHLTDPISSISIWKGPLGGKPGEGKFVEAKEVTLAW